MAFCFGGGGNMEFIYIVKQFVEKEKEIQNKEDITEINSDVKRHDQKFTEK